MSHDKTMAKSSSGILDIFQFRIRLIEEYRSYVTSFIRIADPKIKAFTAGCFDLAALRHQADEIEAQLLGTTHPPDRMN